MGHGIIKDPIVGIAAALTSPNGEPSLITHGLNCSGYRYATVVGIVTTEATDTSDFAVWLFYKTSGSTTKPITGLWVRDTRTNGTGTMTATEGTDGDTVKTELEIAGASRIYVEWESRTDGDTRVLAWILLSNPAVAAG
mgnify:CR=1 FL=1